MLKQLRYFQSVVRLSSFSAAAEENFISQSAISQQIQALERELGFRLLERELGFRLLERKNRSFSLTPAGEYFYQKSLILTADYERMCREAARIAHGDRASLRIGYLRCYTGGEFHRALELFSEQHPDVDVSATYGNHEELYALPRAGEADLRPDIFDRRARCRKSVLPPPSKGKTRRRIFPWTQSISPPPNISTGRTVSAENRTKEKNTATRKSGC